MNKMVNTYNSYKYYDYSVRDKLMQRFGNDTVFNMRCNFKEKDSTKRDNQFDPCELWQFADSRVQHYFIDGRFLTETCFEDDYIAYKYVFGNSEAVFLMFMLTEEKRYFDIDMDYLISLIKQWEAKGYDAYVLTVCIEFENKYDDRPGCRFVTYSKEGSGEAIYELKQIDQKYMLTLARIPCWDRYERKMVSVTASDDILEYECLFDPEVEIASGERRDRVVWHRGIAEIMEFFRMSDPVKLIYRRSEITGAFHTMLIAGNHSYIITVNRYNLISEISVSDFFPKEGDIEDMTAEQFESLTDNVPTANKIRILDKVKMHGYVLQISYAKTDVRNYYLCSFRTPEIEEKYDIEGYLFDDETFASARLDIDGNAVFSNGYIIQKHKLYYRSFRIVQPEITKEVLCETGNKRIESLYRLPLKEFKSHFSYRQYWGTMDECFGPVEAFLDKTGARVSDIMIYFLNTRRDFTDDAAHIVIAPTDKEGYIRDDGSWLIPPVYDQFKGFSDKCILGARKVDGKSKVFIINKKGEERPFEYKIDTDQEYYGTRIPFYTELWPRDSVQYTSVWYDAFADYWMKPGIWGFLDEWGDVVIEPQYVFAEGFDFYLENEELSVATKLIEGKVKWGLIDRNGTEAIPFVYEELYKPWECDDVVAFRREGEELFGLLDTSGNVVCAPKFGYLQAYCSEHRLITAGLDDDHLGVFSLDYDTFVIPCEFDCVDYYDNIIECEESYAIKCRYYSYDFKELCFDGYTNIHEHDGVINARKDGKACVIDLEGNVIIPPVMESNFDYSQELYKRGYFISGTRKVKGLKKTNGEVIIPERYSSIYVKGDFVIASENLEGNWNIKDTLYDLDGNVLIEGVYQKMQYDEKMGELTVDTPLGKEHCVVLSEHEKA